MNTLSNRSVQAILQHLDAEAACLQQIESLAAALTEAGPGLAPLSARQEQLARAIAELQQVEQRRERLRYELAAHWQMPPEKVRLSEARTPNGAPFAQLERRRQEIARQATRTFAVLNVTQSTLSGWSSMLSAVLGEIFGTTSSSDRYSAKGQRLGTSPAYGIEVRT